MTVSNDGKNNRHSEQTREDRIYKRAMAIAVLTGPERYEVESRQEAARELIDLAKGEEESLWAALRMCADDLELDRGDDNASQAKELISEAIALLKK